jgi:hypothetical protein
VGLIAAVAGGNVDASVRLVFEATQEKALKRSSEEDAKGRVLHEWFGRGPERPCSTTSSADISRTGRHVRFFGIDGEKHLACWAEGRDSSRWKGWGQIGRWRERSRCENVGIIRAWKIVSFSGIRRGSGIRGRWLFLLVTMVSL